MKRVFHINTEPHEVEIGGKTLLFEPEIIGAEFAEAFAAMQESMGGFVIDPDNPDPEMLKRTDPALRTFLSALMLPESRETFATMRIPLRALVEIFEWVVELYGGGQGNDPGTSVSDSS